MSPDQIKITIQTNGKKKLVTASPGKLLLGLLREQGFEVYSPCGGNGTCGKCKVYLKNEGYITSCVYTVEEDIEIVLPDALEADILASQYEHSRVVPLVPGDPEKLAPFPYGVAIDIGTTTLAFHLVQLMTGVHTETRTAMNPQAKYGADVISRINFCILNPEGLETMQQEIIRIINQQLIHFSEVSGIGSSDIVKITIAGNTTMLHLLLGENPASLAFVPFTPVFTDRKLLHAKDLSLECHPDAEVNILPSLTAYVGADIVAGIASLAPSESIKNYLFIDVGTNGEMALITPQKIYCCATAAGPAFEGANIEFGMGALQGAISIFDGPGKYLTIGGAKPVGICGSGLIDMVASLVKSGIIAPDGNMESDYLVVSAENSGNNKEIFLTQKDIREVQLAKSAIISGIKLLISEAGLSTNELDALYMAGGFGNYIRTESAVIIGLLPAELADRVIPVGNASGTGALLSLKSVYFDAILNDIKNRMEYIELAEKDDFMMEFAMNMDFLGG
ncbi:MAG: DUF4445 domain-containing protein [Bacteroidales bacterium]|nr:DUF4445 domain-containing protein [Bacteroidales bacterium]